MKTMLITAGLLGVCACAFASMLGTQNRVMNTRGPNTDGMVSCNVNGVLRTVDSESACTALGGTFPEIGPPLAGQADTSTVQVKT